MRILILTQYFWPENFQINDLAQGLVQKGHHVEVLTGKPNYPQGKFFAGYSFFQPAHEMYGGILVHRVPLLPRFRSRGWQLVLNYFSFVIFASAKVFWLGRKKYDLVFVFEPSPILQALPAILLKKIFGASLALWVLDLWPESLEATGTFRSPFVLRWVGYLVNYIYRKCDLILASSETFIPKIRERARPDSSIFYFPNWADALFEKKQNLEISEPKNRDEFNLVFAGNIGKAQSFDTILQAACILKEQSSVRWHIYGDGRERASAEKKARDLGILSVMTFYGMKPLSEMPNIFSKSDALLITLKNDPVFKLTVPAKLQTYLACGKPILACLDGEAALIVQRSVAGFVCPPEDPEKLASSVLKLQDLTSTERQKMGQNGRKYYEKHFLRDLLFDQIDKVFLTLKGRSEHR